MRIRKAQHDDPNAWIRGRHALWPDYDSDGLAAETRTMLESHEEVCFVLSDESSQVVGFISSQSSVLSTQSYLLTPQGGHFRRFPLDKAVLLCCYIRREAATWKAAPRRPAPHTGLDPLFRAVLLFSSSG